MFLMCFILCGYDFLTIDCIIMSKQLLNFSKYIIKQFIKFLNGTRIEYRKQSRLIPNTANYVINHMSKVNITKGVPEVEIRTACF